jgi:mannose-6-phosphate isomerase-like protein (cupin superfamily)
LAPALHNAAHHHEQEQINVGLSGMMQLAIDGQLYSLGIQGATLAPSNVQHALGNALADMITTGIEFQPVPRPDLFPPYPKETSPASAEARSVAGGQQVMADFSVSSPGWQVAANGARSKSLIGKTCRVTMWDLAATKASADLTRTGLLGEQFVYVVAGHAGVTADGKHREIGPQMLVVVSDGEGRVRVEPVGEGRVLFLVFES